MPTFETPGPVLLDLRLPAGEIEIVTSSRGDTDVELEPLRDDEATHEALAAARIESAEQHGRRVVLVDVPSRRGFFGRQPMFRLRVRAPQGSALTCKTRSADVACTGVLGAVDVKTASGDVSLGEVAADAAVNTASGDVRVQTVRGPLVVSTASGDVLVGRAEAGVELNAVSGDVVLREGLGEVRAHTVSGDQQLEAIAGGPISAHSVSGDIAIGIAQGSRVFINASSVSGDTTSDLPMSDAPPAGGPVVDLQANTVSGDIHIRRARSLAPSH